MKNAFLLLLCIFVTQALLIGNFSQAQVPTNGLVAYFPLDGSAINFAGGPGGTIYGATVATDRWGKQQHAMSFNGSNQFIECTSLIPNYENATISVWALVRGECALEAGIVSQPRYSWGTGLQILVSGIDVPNKTVDTGFNNWSDNIVLRDPNTPPCVNVWRHYVVAVGNGSIRYYIDGANVSTATFSLQNVSSSYNFVIGAGTPGSHSPSDYTYLNGIVDDVRVYNRALSSQEVAQLYSAESQVTEPLVKICAPTNIPVRLGIGLSDVTNVTAPILPYGWKFDAASAQIFGRMTGTNPMSAMLTGERGTNSPVSVSFPVVLLPQAAQSIALTVRTIVKVGDIFPLLTTSSSKLPVTVTSSDPNILRVDGSNAAALAKGRVTLTATQDGNEKFAPASPVRRTVIVR